MSNLSELLPAGGGGKNVDFVASGTLSNGQTVVLKTDGTVSSITQTSSSTGTPATFNAGSARTYRPVAVVYHPVQDKTVFFYQDSGGQNFGKAIVGTVSGTTISFAGASEYEFENNTIGEVLTAVYDSNIDRIVLIYELTANSKCNARAVTVSGNTLSFSGSSVISGTTNYENGTACFDPVANKTIFAAASQTSSNYGEARVLTATASTGAGGITSGSPVVFQSNSVSTMQAVYDENSDKTVIVYAQSSFGAKAIVGTVSGTAITFGTAGTVSTADDQPRLTSLTARCDRMCLIRGVHISGMGTQIASPITSLGTLTNVLHHPTHNRHPVLLLSPTLQGRPHFQPHPAWS